MFRARKNWKTLQTKSRKRKIPLRIIKIHTKKLSNLQPKQEDQEARTREILNKFDKKFPKAIVQGQVDEFRHLARDLFSEGAYLEVINYYNLAAFIFLKFGFPDEALDFSNDAKLLQNLVEARQVKLELLTGAFENRNVPIIQTVYEDLIEISQKLNDFASVDRYQSQLERLQHSQFDLRVLNLKPENGLTLNEETCSSNDFEIDQLKQKQLRLGQRAHLLEKRALFNAAAFHYKQCREISTQLANMGLEYERENIDRFQKEQDRCAKHDVMDDVRKIVELGGG